MAEIAMADPAGRLVSNQFDTLGYVVAPSILPRTQLDAAFRYYISYVGMDGFYRIYDKVNALDRYADALSEAWMPDVQKVIEAATGRRLLPTYSFARIYTTESRLHKHVDHHSCEISATMTVGHRNAPAEWPILVESRGNDVPVSLDVGDALIYKGTELPHWREPLSSGIWCQVFFHFVDAAGPFTDRIYDGRSKLGPDPWRGPADLE